MTPNTLLTQLTELIRNAMQTPENVIVAFENTTSQAHITDDGLVCISLDSFEIGDRLTEKDENGEIYTLNTRKYKGSVNFNIYLPQASHPSVAYGIFNDITQALLSSAYAQSISGIKCSDAQYDKDCNALILKGKAVISEIL